jgi:hypothetical protein
MEFSFTTKSSQRRSNIKGKDGRKGMVNTRRGVRGEVWKMAKSP